ncbi:MAG TPA: putative toxin-antitoxin system toxin component, PIN family [Clostridiales bacterium]|nr:putative toxin-antitoxin system toxin component, PIN family [Clostridiales bacterium]
MEIILDTNVLVSALLSPFGAPARVLDLILSQQIILRYDSRIWLEYEMVLARPKFRFDPAMIRQILDYLAIISVPVLASPCSRQLSDQNDLAFYEVYLTSESWLVTGNVKHFPEEPKIVSPPAFLKGIGFP